MDESLLLQIKRLRKNNKNFQARHFLPELSLHELMQKKSVCVTLAGFGVEPYHLDELGDSDVSEGNPALYDAFKRLVVDRIGMCKV